MSINNNSLEKKLPGWLIKQTRDAGFWLGQLTVDPGTGDSPGEGIGESNSETNVNTDESAGEGSGEPGANTGEKTGGDPGNSDGEPNVDTDEKTSGDDQNATWSKLTETLEKFAEIVAPREQEANPEKSEPNTGNSSEADGEPDNKIENLRQELRDLIIQQAGVPEPLKKLLPADVHDLSKFLQSKEYKTLSEALTTDKGAPSNVNKRQPKSEPASERDQEKVKPKTFSEITVEDLKLFDQAFK